MKKRKSHNLILIFAMLTTVLSFFIIYDTVKYGNGYYIGKIESLEHTNLETIVVVSPIPSNWNYILEIKAKHLIKYNLEDISVSGIAEQNKQSRKLKLGELGELVAKYKVGDTIIFHVPKKHYDKREYIIEIDELAIDLTL